MSPPRDSYGLWSDEIQELFQNLAITPDLWSLDGSQSPVQLYLDGKWLLNEEWVYFDSTPFYSPLCQPYPDVFSFLPYKQWKD